MMFETLAYLSVGIFGTVFALVILERMGLPPGKISDNLNNLPKSWVAGLVIVVLLSMFIGNHFTGANRITVAFFANTELWLGLGLLVHLYIKTKKQRVLTR